MAAAPVAGQRGKTKRHRGHESLGDPAKDLRLVELLEKELKLKKAKYDEDEMRDPTARNELIKKIDDFVAKCNSLGQHYLHTEPNFVVARNLLTTAEVVVRDDTPFRQFFQTEGARMRMLSTTYQNLGAVEKAAEQLKLAVEYHQRAIDIEMKLKDLKEPSMEASFGRSAPPPDMGSGAAAPLIASHAPPLGYGGPSPTAGAGPGAPVMPSFAAAAPPPGQEPQGNSEVDNKLLLQACRKGHTEQALQVIKRRTANLNVADSAGNTALHHACQNRMVHVVHELCKAGAFVNPVNDAGHTPLHFTTSSSLELTKILLNTGVDMFIADKSGNTALQYACLANLPDIALLLVDRGADFRKTNNNGNTALHYAVSSSMSSVVEHLLSRGADINCMDSQDNAPLHYACSLLLPSMAMVLIHHKPDLDLVNKAGNTPLLYACSNSMADIAMLMIKKGADIMKADGTGNTALHYAAANQLESVVKALLAHRDVDGVASSPNNEGNTPLHYACSSNNLAIVKLLVEKGVDLTAQDKEHRNTPLHYACLTEQPDVAEYLITEGASAHVQNAHGKTPLDYAVVAL